MGRTAALLFALIHRSAWNKNSANFVFWGFSEVRFKRILRTSHERGSKKFDVLELRTRLT
jgi:hypothetical protein